MQSKFGVLVRQRADQAAQLFLVVLAFSVATSTSLLSVSAILVVLCWSVSGRLRESGREIVANPVSRAILVYVLLLVVGLFWTENLENGLEVIKDRWKIMLMPIFLTVVSSRRRHWYAIAFVAGICAAMGIGYLAFFDLLHYQDMGPEHLTRRTFHVVYNPLLAFAIYLVAHAAIWGRQRPVCRGFLGVLVVVMVVNMFITEGRIGQLAFFVLSTLLLLQFFRRRLAGVLLSIVLVPLLFFMGYQLSPVFKARVDLACQEIQQFDVNPATSVGYRLLYWKNSLQIIRQAPFFGVGTGDFIDAYADVNRQESPDIAPTDNPHNQYLLVLSQFGLLGALVFASLFFVLFRQAVVLPHDGWQRIRFAFPVLFLTIMLTESYLVVYETGFLFSLFAAILYKMPEDVSVFPGNPRK